MAYVPNRLKAMSAGSGIAPGLFTFRTPDSIADITTAGYFKDAVAIFEVGDIVYANVNNNASMVKIICVRSIPVDGGEHDIDFSVSTTFAGDVRATDLTGYQSTNFSGGLGQGGNVFNLYTYRNNTDLTAVVVAADYFLKAGVFLEVGDLIELISNDGHSTLRVLTATPTGVTTEEIIFL